MIKIKRTNGGGLIRLALVIIVILIVLAYFGFNLRGIVASQTFQDNWNFVSGIAQDIWNKYLSGALTFIWNHLIWPLINRTPQSS
jgi:ABC-type phosphate/phosphonate transport system permease subunit